MSDNFFVETPFLTMITGATPLSSSRLWISTTVSLATPPSSDCTKIVFRGCQYQASRIWLTCVWYCNIGNMLIVYSKSDTSPTGPNLSPTCPNKFFMSEPSEQQKPRPPRHIDAAAGAWERQPLSLRIPGIRHHAVLRNVNGFNFGLFISHHLHFNQYNCDSDFCSDFAK